MKYDVLIIGGGITGAGVLRDCAMRGLKALLVEKGEPGSATTAASTHLIHGGLRYLLYDRLTTHTTCWDSGNIVRIARPLLTRLPILWPIYRGHNHGFETVETLLESYDNFSRMKYGLPHLRLNAEETVQLFPSIAAEGLLGAVSFDEWWVEPVALVNANLDSAKAAGNVEIRTRTQLIEFLFEKEPVGQPTRRKRIIGAKLKNSDGSLETVEALVVVNASGPWAAQIGRLAGAEISLRLQKGTHLVYDDWRVSERPRGLLLEAEGRDRYIFVISHPGGTLVGPTDLASPDDPDKTETAPEEIRYLLSSARRYFPSMPERFDRTIVGARPILAQKGSEKLLSREYEVFDHSARDNVAGFITVAGGKMSDFRLMGQDAADAVCGLLGKTAACQTHLKTLAGEPVGDIPAYPRPSRPLKRFLRGHPRLRELHSLAYLGGALARHMLRRALARIRVSTRGDFELHYSR